MDAIATCNVNGMKGERFVSQVGKQLAQEPKAGVKGEMEGVGGEKTNIASRMITQKE